MNPLQSDETVLTGQSVFQGRALVADQTGQRIDWLVDTQLVFLADRPDDGWISLYVDPLDGRYWELSYPQSHLQGGGPRELTCLHPEVAKARYPDVMTDPS
ncbi:Imm27 family immunity protein [Planctomicrobium piriforme]|uniref:Imm27 family immunity protein n=1 Tax=Planctomicrobium piriforme TaxID=1576369 RepID=UPI001C31C3DB